MCRKILSIIILAVCAVILVFFMAAGVAEAERIDATG